MKGFQDGRALFVDEVSQCIQAGCGAVPLSSNTSPKLPQSRRSYHKSVIRQGWSRHTFQWVEFSWAFLVVVKVTEIYLALFLAEGWTAGFPLVTEELLGILNPVTVELAFGKFLGSGVLFVLYCSAELVVFLQE